MTSPSVQVASQRNVAANKAIATPAADRLAFDTGAAELPLNKDGSVTLDGKDIAVKASGRIDAKANDDVVLKGSKILQN